MISATFDIMPRADSRTLRLGDLMWFDVVAAGEGTAARLEWRHSSPDDALQRFGFSEEEVARLKLNPKMYNSFLDTTKCAVEMVAVCDATGLKPDVRGMHFPLGSVKDVPRLLSLKMSHPCRPYRST